MTIAAVETQPQLRVVAVGHVDHGKSTMIGRLLHDTGNLPDGKVEELTAASVRRGDTFEWSFALDAMQSERDQAVTIDTTRIWLRTPARDVVLIDAPGHEEFLRNMVTGASDADAALLLVDAHDGLGEQTRRHVRVLELIGVTQAVVAINKMDRVGYDRARYDAIRLELEQLLEHAGVRPLAFVPTCARDGENLVTIAPAMPWYDGPTVLAAILAGPPASAARGDGFRLAVQGVVRRDLRRIVVGRVENGTVAVGDRLAAMPGGRIARVAAIASFPETHKTEASAGESIGLEFEGRSFIDRGDVLADVQSPPALTDRFRARLLWLGRAPLRAGDGLRMRYGTRAVAVTVAALERVLDIGSLDRGGGSEARTNDIADVSFACAETLPIDPVSAHPGLARFVLLDGVDIVAGGTILEALAPERAARSNVVPVAHLLSAGDRRRRGGHRGVVVWLTGLPASGKSTIAMELERRLVECGASAYVLDGDNVRAGLCSDLGFSREDRIENVRRVGAVAALFADAGTIAIAAFISPYRAGRHAAREATGDDFHEIYIKADAVACEARDPKGHYRKARAGELPDFTGITGDYEVPLDPELTLDTTVLSIEASVETLFSYVLRISELGHTDV